MNTNRQVINANQLIKSILQKYIKLGLNNSDLFKQLQKDLQNQIWVDKIQTVLSKVKNSNYIFSISTEINKDKNDQRVREMFAEFDVAQRLLNTKFFGSFTNVEYLIKDKNYRSPDFLVYENASPVPVEVKFLTPQDLNEKKFFQKLIDKINNHALQQLNSFYEEKQFKKGVIFIWSDKPVKLANITYSKLEEYFKEKVSKQKFEVTIICILSGLGLWDFYI
ncbi:MAG: hypothetical protein UR68_C0014G0009 [Candidatus Roizmanbacteria bacterium GW2011_GWA2_35_19]|uniref:Uncharacterized protein n=2 Tax=Candidatus Roizmaniibacteriota TaxID=1752723 RepID=A0A0G0BSR2_9BACT|nr:MAG: hypothetical protein UR63_C0022G0009 [Candidatus Roizmanbacteria bacterium GW2011_GWC2_35_12]KKP72539.1 MAG: hypothetical protein UR68_C0014G0009 [Candidatus Roizmanbacteria bacterium GW2011_GWA2_35_19]